MQRFSRLYIPLLILGFGLPSCASALHTGSTAKGKASWYGESHQGNRTASGEKFDLNQLTAAHRTLPMGSMVKVTSLSTGKSVTVRINDRGPFTKGRILDVSQAAAQKLGFIQKGTDHIKMEVVSIPGQ
ncbi:septal ring lytic transglycosylase RlpA family lipoprotein [Bdellovibrio sp. ZAP7]|uniref:septal ring lytic transglycosylase RlpA family protein n=1 Tax=Bdellovibrio sp. ZAP7 TaxID=2231053 RepID=UPI00115BF642|nr:septal ring lytic transglycosylase RlpA family protein [Bdellovibrio sp. ZAP7]QDK44439.1 septal ring lytic transglycosylase RlpA family lipoprotein [Bdellovibrio sp. ZAP7]